MLVPQSVSYATSLAKLSPVTGLVSYYSVVHPIYYVSRLTTSAKLLYMDHRLRKCAANLGRL